MVGPSTPGRIEITQVHSGLREALYRARNSDGGWAYSAGKRSRIEPTCWALLALAGADRRPVEFERLRSWPRHDGWLVDIEGAPVNQAFNALAALVLLQDASTAPIARGIGTNLLSAKGRRYRQSEFTTEDNSIQAWSWIDGTSSWVEPTAWSLLLLKKLRRNGLLPQQGTERIQAGEQLLMDRVCVMGGWNYGNKNVYGHDLWPYVPTTALALLALQDHRDLAAVKRSLAQMQVDQRTERSALALALAVVCLKVYGLNSAPEAADTLLEIRNSDPSNVDIERDLARLAADDLEGNEENVLGMAMALFALSQGSGAPHLFSI